VIDTVVVRVSPVVSAVSGSPAAFVRVEGAAVVTGAPSIDPEFVPPSASTEPVFTSVLTPVSTSVIIPLGSTRSTVTSAIVPSRTVMPPMCSVVSSGRRLRVIVILVVVAERIGLVVTVVTAVPPVATRVPGMREPASVVLVAIVTPPVVSALTAPAVSVRRASRAPAIVLIIL